MNKTKLKYYCKNCNKRINALTALYGTGFCLSCVMSKVIRHGENHQSFLHGKFSKDFHNYCECGKEICGVSKRCRSCARKEQYKQDITSHPMFIDGHARIPYPSSFSNELKLKIRDRDGHSCQKCGKTEQKLQKELSIHHIDYNKENCRKENLISLCNSCHSQSNNNRDYWFAYYTELILCYFFII
jgi:hypothetical protein